MKLQEITESIKEYFILQKVKNQLLKQTVYIYNFGYTKFRRLPDWNQRKLVDLYIQGLIDKDFTNVHFFMELWAKTKLKGVASNYWASNGKAKIRGNVIG